MLAAACPTSLAHTTVREPTSNGPYLVLVSLYGIQSIWLLHQRQLPQMMAT